METVTFFQEMLVWLQLFIALFRKPLSFHTVGYKYTNPKNNCRGKAAENVTEYDAKYVFNYIFYILHIAEDHCLDTKNYGGWKKVIKMRLCL